MFYLLSRLIYAIVRTISDAEHNMRTKREDKRLDVRVREMLDDANRRAGEREGERPLTDRQQLVEAERRADKRAKGRPLDDARDAGVRRRQKLEPEDEVREAGRAAYNPMLLWGLGIAAALLVGCMGLVAVALVVGEISKPDSAGPSRQPARLPPPNARPPARNAPPVAAEVMLAQWRVEDGGNGHYYEFVSGNFSWTQAKRGAEARSVLEVRGHLATIASQQENDFLHRTFPTRSGWLGGFQDKRAPDYAEPAGGWKWVTGEVWGYTNWAPVEPNNFGRGEDFLQSDGLKWNDMPDEPLVNQGYFVEYPIGAKDK